MLHCNSVAGWGECRGQDLKVASLSTNLPLNLAASPSRAFTERVHTCAPFAWLFSLQAADLNLGNQTFGIWPFSSFNEQLESSFKATMEGEEYCSPIEIDENVNESENYFADNITDEDLV